MTSPPRLYAQSEHSGLAGSGIFGGGGDSERRLLAVLLYVNDVDAFAGQCDWSVEFQAEVAGAEADRRAGDWENFGISRDFDEG